MVYFSGWTFARIYGTSTPWQRPRNGGNTARIQHSQESLQSLATRYSINPKTVAKWRKRPSVLDARMGPEPVSTVFSPEQEAIA
jgi:hypothetical protein